MAPFSFSASPASAVYLARENTGKAMSAGRLLLAAVLGSLVLAHSSHAADMGKIKPQIAAVETLWSPASLWEKRESEKIGKIVFSIRS